jgi:hypothetical protein
MSIEAMKQALRTLDAFTPHGRVTWILTEEVDVDETVVALRKAIEQVEKQEPVAWVYLETWTSGKAWADDCFTEDNASPEMTPLYTAPQNIKFPVSLRKMWTGQEVQQWLDENT